jgi:hypothetical protein
VVPATAIGALKVRSDEALAMITSTENPGKIPGTMMAARVEAPENCRNRQRRLPKR